MRRLLAPLIPLLLFTACNQAPAPEAHPILAPAFGSANSNNYDLAHDLAQHVLGTFVVGTTAGDLDAPNAGIPDAFIRMYASSGALLWGRQFGTSSSEQATGVASPSNGDVYITGNTAGNLAGSIGRGDAFLRKYTSGGFAVWTRQFGTSSYDGADSVAALGSNIYVAGTTSGNLAGSVGGSDVFLRNYNSSGSTVWTRQFGTSGGDIATDVAVASNGYIYVVGSTNGSLFGRNGGGSDMFIRAYFSTGGVLWTRQLHWDHDDRATAVAVSGNYVYLIGHSDPANTSRGNTVHVYKYTFSGSLVWSRLLRDHRSLNTISEASADVSGNLYLTGTTRAITLVGAPGGYVRKVSANGVTLWTRRVGGGESSNGLGVLAHTSGEVYAAGYAEVAPGLANNFDAYLSKLRGADGVIVWTR